MSFTKAAEQAFRSQPALSRQVAQLERDLGISLLVRDGRTVTLTAAGADLYERSMRLLWEADDLHARAQALAAGDAEIVRVGVHPMALDRAVPSVLTEYAKQFEHVSVNVVEGETPDLTQRLESRDLDVAFGRFATSDLIAALPLFPMHLIAIISRQHRLAHRKSLEVAELQREPVLLMTDRTGSRVLLDQACEDGKFRLLNVRLESSLHSGLIGMAKAKHGIAVLLSMASFDQSDLAIIPVTHKGEHLGIWSAVLWHRRVDQPGHVQAFILAAQRAMKNDFPGSHYQFPVRLSLPS